MTLLPQHEGNRGGGFFHGAAGDQALCGSKDRERRGAGGGCSPRPCPQTLIPRCNQSSGSPRELLQLHFPSPYLTLWVMLTSGFLFCSIKLHQMEGKNLSDKVSGQDVARWGNRTAAVRSPRQQLPRTATRAALLHGSP